MGGCCSRLSLLAPSFLPFTSPSPLIKLPASTPCIMFSLSTYTSLPRTSRLSLLFLLFSFLFASSAVVLIVVSQVWRFEAGDKMGRHALRNMVVGEMDLTGELHLDLPVLKSTN